MNKLLLILGGFVAAVVLLVGGIALGDVLTDDSEAAADSVRTDDAGTGSDDGAAADGPRQVAAATAVAGDPADEPTSIPTVDETSPPTWPAVSPFQVAEGDDPDDSSARLLAEELEAIYDPETGVDSGATGEPWVPPTSPSFDPETDEVDPDSPAERVEGVEEVPGDAAEDLFIPYLGIGFPFRFVDDCAGDSADGEPAADECPEGIGGTIQLTGAGDPPDPLSIMRQLYTSIGVPLELRCEGLGFAADGTHRAIFASNNPATFTITYWPSTEPSAARTIEYETPESERDRWVERRLAGEPTYDNMHMGIHNCPEIPGLFPGRHTTFEIHGVDDAGTEADARIYYTPPTEVAGNASVGRPHATFVPLDAHSGRGVVTVPYNERTERVYVASLPRAGAGATTESCTDVENGVLAGTRRLDGSIYNWETTTFPRSADDGFEPGIESAVVTDFAGAEGTTYDLCVWVTKPPVRSFDKPPVVMREVFTVRPPRRWRVRLLVGGGHTDAPLEANAIRIRPTNWPNPTAATWPTESVPAGAFMLSGMELLRDGGSQPVPSITLLEVTGPSGTSSEVSIPTPTNCTFPMPCTRAGFQQYDVVIPGRIDRFVMCGGGPCEEPTSTDVVGNLRLVVETYAGPGGAPTGGMDGADGWQVDHATSFAAATPDALPATPRIDQNRVVLEAIGGTGGISGGRPAVRFAATFDRPVQVTAVPQVALGAPCPAPVAPQSTEGFTQVVDMTFAGLCWGSTYGIDLIATDAAGNVLDARTVVDGVPTGRGAWRIVDMPKVPITQYSVRTTVDQIGEGYGASHLRVGPVEVVPHGVGTRCIAGTEPHEITVRNSGGRPIVVDDPWLWALEVRQSGDGRDCGDRRHGEWMRIDAAVSLDELLAGPVTLHYTHDDGTDVTVEIYDVVWG